MCFCRPITCSSLHYDFCLAAFRSHDDCFHPGDCAGLCDCLWLHHCAGNSGVIDGLRHFVPTVQQARDNDSECLIARFDAEGSRMHLPQDAAWDEGLWFGCKQPAKIVTSFTRSNNS